MYSKCNYETLSGGDFLKLKCNPEFFFCNCTIRVHVFKYLDCLNGVLCRSEAEDILLCLAMWIFQLVQKTIYCGEQCMLLLCWLNIFYLHWFGFISSLTYTLPWSSGLEFRYHKLSSMPICSSFRIVQYISWHVLFMNMYTFINTHMHAVALVSKRGQFSKRFRMDLWEGLAEKMKRKSIII